MATTKKGSSRPTEKSRKMLMMMKAAKLGPGARQEQGWSKARAGRKHEQGRSRNRAGAELSRVKQNREERGQELGRKWL